MKTVVRTDAAPKAIGPYSQAVLADGWLYCSGQIPLDPATMQIVPGTRRPRRSGCCSTSRRWLRRRRGDVPTR